MMDQWCLVKKKIREKDIEESTVIEEKNFISHK